jgi:hypothetical protein
MEKAIVKKEQNGRESLRRLKPTVGCNASKRRRRSILAHNFCRGLPVVLWK